MATTCNLCGQGDPANACLCHEYATVNSRQAEQLHRAEFRPGFNNATTSSSSGSDSLSIGAIVGIVVGLVAGLAVLLAIIGADMNFAARHCAWHHAMSLTLLAATHTPFDVAPCHHC
jgi:hypothetical protein